MKLGDPPWGMPCNPPVLEYLRPDQTLCRVFNSQAAKAGRYHGLSFNPSISAPDAGGRFDATVADRFEYLYGAQTAKTAATVALLETLRPLWSLDEDRGRQVIQRAALEARSIQYFTVSDQVTLASLRSPAALARLNAVEEVCYDASRAATKEWARYFRSKLHKDISGLAYNSTRSSLNPTGPSDASFVLWADRMNGERVDPISAPLPLGHGPGRDLAEAVFSEFDVQIL